MRMTYIIHNINFSVSSADIVQKNKHPSPYNAY